MSTLEIPTAPRQSRAVLALVALALPTLLVAVDISVLNVALPTMGRDLHAGATQLLWMTDSYNFMVAGAMLSTGAIADRIGRRRMILVCAAIFAAASTVGAFATSAELVIVARGVMGLAGSAILPASMALLAGLFVEEKARIQAMGVMMTVFLGGMAVAPFVGGLLLAHFWWGSVFLIGVPVMAVTMVAVPRLVPEAKAEAPAPLDLTSAALSLVAVLSLVFALKRVVNTGLDPAVVLATVVGLALGTAFVRRQRRLAHPLVDLDLLTRPQVRRTLMALFLTAVLMGGISLFFNLYLQEVQGLSALGAAWWMLPQMLAMIASANLGPLLNRRLPQRTVVILMLSLMTAGFVLFATVPEGTFGRPWAALAGSLATFGIGACFPLLMDGVMRAAPMERAASSAAMAQLANELGIALGLTLLGSLGTIVYRARLGHPGTAAAQNVIEGVQAGRHDAALLDQVHAAWTDAFHVAGALGVAVMLVVIVLAARAAAPRGHRRAGRSRQSRLASRSSWWPEPTSASGAAGDGLGHRLPQQLHRAANRGAQRRRVTHEGHDPAARSGAHQLAALEAGHGLVDGELGQQGDPDPAGDEGQGGVVVVGPRDESRREPGGSAGVAHDHRAPGVAEVGVDHRDVGESGHRDRAGVLTEQLVAERDGDPVALLDQHDPLVARALGSRSVGVLGGDVDVAALGRRRRGVPELVETQLEDQVGELLLQAPGDVRQPHLRRRGEGADRQAAGVPLAQVLDDAAQPAQAAHELLALGGQHLGARRRGDPSAGLLEQHQARLALQRGDLLAHRRGREAQVVGRGLHRPAGHHGPEHPQSLHVDHGFDPTA
ncbi:MAG: MFS transporter [Nocardioides sp.]